MDDPLAAVDAHVASYLLANVFGRRGILSTKTRIITTHNPHAIQAADNIAIIENGRIVEYGTYSKLTQHRTSRLNHFLAFKDTEESEKRRHEESGPQRSGQSPNFSDKEYHRTRCLSDTQRSVIAEPVSMPADLAECEFSV